MPLPDGLATFILTGGAFTDATGAVALAGVQGTLVPVDGAGRPTPVLHPATGKLIVPAAVPITVGGDGTWSLSPLPYTDDPAFAAPFRYSVTWNVSSVTGASPLNKIIEVPTGSGSVIDYDLLGSATGSVVTPVALPIVTSVNGHTGAVTLVESDVGLGNVDNTSDASKPVSTAQATALAAKAVIADISTPGTATGDALRSGFVASVTAFGAVGDGSTDDTGAIGAAIDAAVSAGGGTIVIPANKVFIYSSLLKTASRITVTGGGTLRSTLGKTSNTIAFQLIGNDITIDGVTFDYTVAVNVASSDVTSRGANGKTIRIGGTNSPSPAWRSNLRVINCTIRDARNTAIDIYYGNKVLVAGNTIERSLGNGIFITDCQTDLRITGNTIFDTGDDSMFVAADANLPGRTLGVVITGNNFDLTDGKCIGIGGVDGAVIANNTLKRSYAPAIQLINDSGVMNSSLKVVISGNAIYLAGQNFGGSRLHSTQGTSGSGIELGSTPSDVAVANNVITGAAKLGVNVVNGGNRLRITDNHIDSCGSNGISVGSLSDTTYQVVTDLQITGNTLRQVRGAIIVGSATGVKISDNQIRSYSSGGGSGFRGIQYAYLNRAHITDNVIINDDGGGAQFFDSAAGQSLSLRIFGNSRAPSTGPAADSNTGQFNLGANALAFAAAIPTSGYWVAGDRVLNSASTAGAIADWTCSTTGVAAGTAWALSTAYTVGQQAYNGTNVYVVTGAGTSASSGGPTGTTSPITDGTVTWAYMATRAAFASPAAPTVAGIVLQRTKTGTWIAPAAPGRSTSAAANNRLFFSPIAVSQACTVSSLNVNVTTAGQSGATALLGLYADDGTTNPTGSPLASGSVAVDTTGAKAVTGLSVALAPGTYWVAFVAQNAATTAPTMTTLSGQVPGLPSPTTLSAICCAIYGDGQTGALSNPPGSLAVFTATSPVVAVGI